MQTDAPWLRPLPPDDIHQFAMMGVTPPRDVADEPDELFVGTWRPGVLWRNEPQADGRAHRCLHLQADHPWLLYWYQAVRLGDITALFDRLAPLIAAATISAPVAATCGFAHVGEAIRKATERTGKVLFTPGA